MAFADEVVKPDRGFTFKMDISLDQFSTISYRYSTHGGIDASNDYDARIVSISPFTRGLGEDHIIQSGTLDVEFANEDEIVDWMVDTANATDVLKARCRLYVGIYDPAASPISIQWKQLGELIFSEFPTRNEATVSASLADDALGHLEHPAGTPTLQDWYDQDDDPATNPLRNGYEFVWYTDKETAIPLAFGEDEVQCVPAGRYLEHYTGTPDGSRCWVVCCTTDTATTINGEVSHVWVRFHRDGPLFRLDASTESVDSGTPGFRDVWSVHRSETITKHGKSYRVIYLLIDWLGYMSWILNTFNMKEPQGEGAGGSNSGVTSMAEVYADQIHELWCLGYPLSATTYITTVDPSFGLFGAYLPKPAAEIAKDIANEYTRATTANVDDTAFDQVRDDVGEMSNAVGIINGVQPGTERTLREHLSDLCASHDFDIFSKWDGSIAATAWNLTYDEDALVEFEETDIADFADTIPSREQRGAPFNRIILSGARPNPWQTDQAPATGPFDSPGGEATAWGRAIQRELDQSWVARQVARLNPWRSRNVDGSIKARVSFTVDARGLLLELGDYFKFTWTRNLGDPYVSAIAKVEELTLDCDNLTVQVVALVVPDTSDTAFYVLDNETLLTRASGSGGRTATVTDSDATVTFSSGNLTSDGVAAGDHLILKDSTESATLFTRNRAIRIGSVTDATHLELDSADLDFDAPGGTAVSAWEIRRSHTTYHTAATDAVNYPDGGAKYGRVANASTATAVYSASGPEGLTTVSHKVGG